MPHTPQAIDCSQLEDGEVVVQCEMLSVDAFLRTMLDEEAYHGAIRLGDTLPALGYGRVIASANPKFKIGKRVTGMLGARSVARLKAEQSAGLFPFLSLPRVKPTTMMGLLGITSGLTAHVGIHSVTKPPRRGQTVLVSGASGATGSVAAQLAKLTGAKVVGVAGGVMKAAYLLDELKLDGAVDYKDGATTLGAQLDRLVRRVPRSSTVPSASCISVSPRVPVPPRRSARTASTFTLTRSEESCSTRCSSGSERMGASSCAARHRSTTAISIRAWCAGRASTLSSRRRARR